MHGPLERKETIDIDVWRSRPPFPLQSLAIAIRLHKTMNCKKLWLMIRLKIAY